MVGTLRPANLQPIMIRFAPYVFVGLICVLGARSASAQDDSELVTRVDRMEQTIRNLTGQVEQLQYHNQQLEQQVQRLQQLVQGGAPPSTPPPHAEYSPPPPPPAQYSSPPRYSSAPPPAYPSSPPAYPPTASAAAPPPETGRHDAFNPSGDPGAPGVPRPLGSSTMANEPPPPRQGPPPGAPSEPGTPLDLSSPAAGQAGPPSNGPLPPPPPANPSATGGMQASIAPPPVAAATPKDEYELGRGYFGHRDYMHAAETFGDFVHKYPSDHLTPEAQYWLGESLFQNKRYHDAAEAFLIVSTKYGTIARAPDAMLRLGQSLESLGQKEAACASLGEVLRKYPRASLSVKENVAREQKRAHC